MTQLWFSAKLACMKACISEPGANRSLGGGCNPSKQPGQSLVIQGPQARTIHLCVEGLRCSSHNKQYLGMF
jgi:hypothetical protein